MVINKSRDTWAETSAARLTQGVTFDRDRHVRLLLKEERQVTFLFTTHPMLSAKPEPLAA